MTQDPSGPQSPGSPESGAGSAGSSMEAGSSAEGGSSVEGDGIRITRWPRSRVYHVLARTALIIGMLCTLMGASIIAACFTNDAIIDSARGQTVAEVINTSSPMRTVVRYTTDDGRVFLPPGGILYPQGLRKGQMVRIEYDKKTPDLARVQGRNGFLAFQPVLMALAGAWAVVVVLRWRLLRLSRRHAALETAS